MGKSFLKNLTKSVKKNNFIEITDYIYPLTKLSDKKYEIINHINLSGKNPLKGPRFVSLSNVYSSKKGIIVVGLKKGIKPNLHEKKILLKASVKAYCYNLIPDVILAASKGLTVKAVGIVKS